MASQYAAVDAVEAASADLAASCSRGEHEDPLPPPGFTPHIHERLPPSSSTPRRTSFPISFPPISFQLSKAPSTTLAPSTAEGKTVPHTNDTDSHRTSALQKLNSKYPTAVRRQGYAPEACGAQSSTYSQPVLVRTYSGPPPSQGSRSTRSPQYRPPSSSRGGSRRVPLPSSPIPGQPAQPAVSGVGVGTTSSGIAGFDSHRTDANDSHVHEVNMPRPYKPKKASSNGGSKLSLPWPWPMSSRQAPEEPKLPPLEAFSFKSFMADLQAPGGENDIGADLDRIAEICARSRYSLSNQYEVHVAPHGSGSSFVSGAGLSPSSAPRRKGHSHSRSRSHGQGVGGPTLQAIPSDDENSARSHTRRRNAGRRRSAAYGTLETIMSSSRSSEEDKAKKKSAAELVGEVRGRAARKAWDNPSGSGTGSGGSGGSASASASASTGNGGAADTQAGQQQGTQPAADAAKLARKKSASFATAIMDSSGRSSGRTTTTAASTSSSSRRRYTTAAAAAAHSKSAVPPSALLSEPARPQTSNSHLGVRTTGPDVSHIITTPHHSIPSGGVVGDITPPHRMESTSSTGRASQAGSWNAWIPWRMTGQQQQEQQEQQEQQQGEGEDGGVDHLQETSPRDTTTMNTAGARTTTMTTKTTKASHAEGSLRQLLRSTGG